MSTRVGRDNLRALYANGEEFVRSADIEAIIVADLYKRRHAASRGDRIKNPRPTPAQVLEVRWWKANFPDDLDFEIGRACDIEMGGRVSEILYGDECGLVVYDLVTGVHIPKSKRTIKVNV